jgi:hypothetical protein
VDKDYEAWEDSNEHKLQENEGCYDQEDYYQINQNSFLFSLVFFMAFMMKLNSENFYMKFHKIRLVSMKHYFLEFFKNLFWTNHTINF